MFSQSKHHLSYLDQQLLSVGREGGGGEGGGGWDLPAQCGVEAGTGDAIKPSHRGPTSYGWDGTDDRRLPLDDRTRNTRGILKIWMSESVTYPEQSSVSCQLQPLHSMARGVQF